MRSWETAWVASTPVRAWLVPSRILGWTRRSGTCCCFRWTRRGRAAAPIATLPCRIPSSPWHHTHLHVPLDPALSSISFSLDVFTGSNPSFPPFQTQPYPFRVSVPTFRIDSLSNPSFCSFQTRPFLPFELPVGSEPTPTEGVSSPKSNRGVPPNRRRNSLEASFLVGTRSRRERGEGGSWDA